jgi:hypothetical protein
MQLIALDKAFYSRRIFFAEAMNQGLSKVS